MISPGAKQQYLDRKLKAYDNLKQLSEATLDKNIAALPVQLDYVYPLKKHQKIGFLIGSKLSSFLYFYEAGTGKTLIILSLIRYHMALKRMKRVLILCPKSSHVYGWEDELNIHAPDLKYQLLADESTLDRIDLIEKSDANVFVLNYMGLIYLGTSKAKASKKTKANKKDKAGQVIDLDKIDWLASQFDTIIIDESQYTSNHQSLTYKVANLVAEQCNFRYALSGTPMDGDPHKLWSQFHLVDRGETLGKTLGMFRECFFKTKQNYWGGYSIDFIPKMTEKLNEVIKNRSLWYSADECQTLPKQVPINKFVSFPGEIEAYYKKVEKELFESRKNYELSKNSFLRMRQLSSGFMGITDSDTGDKERITFKDNPKLDCLLDLISEIPANEKILIFNEFIYSGDLISEALDKLKIKHCRLYSGTKDDKLQIKRFKTDPKYRIMVANSMSGGEGLNLQISRNTIYYELPVSAITYQQSLKRTHREGQNASSVFYYYLLMRGTNDKKMLQSLIDGKNLMDAVLAGDFDKDK